MPVTSSTRKPQLKYKWNYPALGVSQDSGAVVLFNNHGCGMVLEAGKNRQVGEYLTNWTMSTFRLLPKDSEVTIKQG